MPSITRHTACRAVAAMTASWFSIVAFAQQSDPPPLPDGPGKAVVEAVCTQCHDHTNITKGKRTSADWEETIEWMKEEGAQVSDDDFELILAYLNKYFGREPERLNFTLLKAGH